MMHVGEKPYVVTASSSMNAYRGPLAWGQVELSSRVLTFDAVSSMLGQILPADQQLALTEFGAIEHEIPSPAGIADRFTVVAARGGEDVWVEVRRRPIEVPTLQVTAEELAAASVEAAAAEPVSAPEPIAAPEPVAAPEPQVQHATVIDPAAEVALQEIEVVADVEAESPAADVTLDSNESIVVAIPGEAAEEFALNGVADNAIQVIDEEPQGVPTEEEVDAMLAGTSATIMTSGMAGEVVPDETETTDEPIALVIDESFDDETELDLSAQMAPPSEPATPHDAAAPELVEPVAGPCRRRSFRNTSVAQVDAFAAAEVETGSDVRSGDARDAGSRDAARHAASRGSCCGDGGNADRSVSRTADRRCRSRFRVVATLRCCCGAAAGRRDRDGLRGRADRHAALLGRSCARCRAGCR